MAASDHVRFQRFGRCYHLRIADAGDLLHVLELDEALWVATGAPIDTINCDGTFLKWVDTDHNGRIMCFEVKDAIRWLTGVLSDLTGVTEADTTLHLDAINTDHAHGRRILASASKMLDRLGRNNDKRITLDEVRQIKATVESTPVSEAGVVLPEAADDPHIRQFICDIIGTVGGVDHPSGKTGVGQAQLSEFLQQARQYLDWRGKGQIPPAQDKTEVMPFGADTPELFALYCRLADKIEQYFAQCEAVAFDPRTVEHIAPGTAELQAVDFQDPSAIEKLMKEASLAEPVAERVLTFDDRINLYYAADMELFRSGIVEPTFGRGASCLSQAQWEQIKQLFAPHKAWIDARTGQAVEKLGVEKLTEYLQDRYRAAVEALIAESTETAFVLDNIRLTEKLILYQAYMLSLVNNFVSFPNLYDASRRAMFEMGAVIMDGRLFDLAVRADNPAQHSAVAKTSNMFVMYVDVVQRDGQVLHLAVPVTAGGKGNLCVGKRGVFISLAGEQLDAKVAQIIENPISITEALISPFQRIGRLITGKIEAMTTAAEKKLDTTTVQAVERVQQAGPAAPGKPSGLAAGGLIMGGGVALAALSSAAAYITKTLGELGTSKIIIGIVTALVAVMLPTSIVAFLKLRSRDLSAILEGSGWGINARMKLTLRQARFFTRQPRFPKGAKGVHRLWYWIVLGLAALIAASTVTWYIKQKKAKVEPLAPAATQPA